MSVPSVEHKPHHHIRTETLPGDTLKPRVVLVGNPNVGKSVVFNYLSGLYVDVSNFPGTTVEVAKASYLHYDLFDTPGVYGVSSFNDEERVARDIILNADIIVNIVDAVHLERDLFLTQQLIDMGKRVCVVVNMIDEAKKQKLAVDLATLEEELDVPVLGTVAIRKEGLDGIHALITRAREGRQREALHAELHRMLSVVGSQAEALLVLEGDPIVAARHGIAAADAARREEIYIDRRNRVNRIVHHVVKDVQTRKLLSTRIGRASVSPWFGFPILAFVLYLVYLFVGVFVAQDVVGITEGDIGKGIVEFHIKEFVAAHAAVTVTATVLDDEDEVLEERAERFANGVKGEADRWRSMRAWVAERAVEYDFAYENPWLVLFFGEFGAVTMTLTYLIFLLLPLVLGFISRCLYSRTAAISTTRDVGGPYPALRGTEWTRGDSAHSGIWLCHHGHHHHAVARHTARKNHRDHDSATGHSVFRAVRCDRRASGHSGPAGHADLYRRDFRLSGSRRHNHES